MVRKINRRALYYGLLYSASIVIFKCIIINEGLALSKFGFYYSTIVSSLLIIPFLFIAVYQAGKKDFENGMSKREGIRVGLTVVAISSVILTMYNFIEFEWWYRDIAIIYYNSEEYKDILLIQQKLHPDKLKVDDFQKIISDQINQLSAFKSSTGKLIPLIFIGLASSFMSSISFGKN